MERQEIENKINDLKSQLTGNLFNDMDIKDEIHSLEMKLNGVTMVCSMEEGCLTCGS